jgi:phenylpropionate dioxygenase-like ring-hydroxylating dioxygenase large terminal subunit
MTITDQRPPSNDEPLAPDFVPRERYTSREFLALEQERLWPRVWQIACREEEIPNVGDFVDYTIGDESILVVRSDSSTVRAYFNSCLHRGTKLKTGCGNAKELRCPYHAWRWALDGSIKEVVDRNDFRPDLVHDDGLRLPEAKVGTWGGFVWINMDPDCQPLEQALYPVAERMEKYQLHRMRYRRWRSTIVPANWKVALDAFNEGYHVQGTHPQVLAYMDDTKWRYENFDSGNSIYWMMFAETIGRPSPRLGKIDYDSHELLMAQVTEFVNQGIATAEEMAAAEAISEGDLVEGEEYRLLAQIKRNAFERAGVDVTHLTDRDLAEGDDPHVFPNFVGVITVGNAFLFRFRPNGDDPDSCHMDEWNLQLYPDPDTAREYERIVVDDCLDYDWGSIGNQDMSNMALVQQGLHSRASKGVRLGAQEANLRHFHATLERVLGL